MNLLPKVDKSWTLFLDRDGVINHEKKNDYIRNAAEFKFYDGVPNALHHLSQIFGTIVMVTNQRGIGKNLMTENDLAGIHSHMLNKIQLEGGRIDKIYYCTSLHDNCIDRKPNAGMAHQAKNDFPAIDYSKSMMVGNKLSDMLFGRNAGMVTVYVDTTHPEIEFPHEHIDFRFSDLSAFAKEMSALTKS